MVELGPTYVRTYHVNIMNGRTRWARQVRIHSALIAACQDARKAEKRGRGYYGQMPDLSVASDRLSCADPRNGLDCLERADVPRQGLIHLHMPRNRIPRIYITPCLQVYHPPTFSMFNIESIQPMDEVLWYKL